MSRPPVPVHVIEPRRPLSLAAGRELWRFRDLLYFLTWRDVKVRYKQSWLGASWAVLQPLGYTVVFSVFLGRFAGVPSDGVSYALFALAGVVPWALLSQAITGAATSLVNNATLVSRAYFPRLLLPVASATALVLDFAIAALVLVVATPVLGMPLSLRAVALLGAGLLAFAVATAAGILLAALNVRYRDVKHALPFALQLWLFMSPVAYPLSVVPDRWRWAYELNPVVAVTELSRWAVIEGRTLPVRSLLAGTITTLAITAAGLLYFHSVERSMADEI